MARQGFLNGKLYTYTAEEEAAQDAEESKTLAEDAAIKYVNERQVGTATTVGYGTVEEQLDKLYRDINAGKFGSDAKTGEWYVGISSVKTAFPKP
tara:strand:- start:828 stop:1112 length:285 start_codon:yes stop_codon:yes gene_type:complete